MHGAEHVWSGELPTVVVSRKVRPGCEEAYAAWADGLGRIVSEFPGYVRCQVVPPVAGAQPEWVFVYTFDSPQHLQAWIHSDIRAKWLAQAEALVEGKDRAQLISGLEVLFGLLPPTVAPPPPVWKVAVSVLAGLFPVSLLNALFLTPRLKGLPLSLRVLASAAIVVAVMTWVVMPAVTRLLRFWLYPRRT